MAKEKMKVSVSLADWYFISVTTTLGKVKEEPHFSVPFILTCVATLEYLLNDLIFQYAMYHSPEQNCVTLLEPYYSLPFKKKLRVVPSLVTANRLTVNPRCTTYKRLCELINARNKLVHNKTLIQEVDVDVSRGQRGEQVRLDIRQMEKNALKNHPMMFGFQRCEEFYKALLDFSENVHDGAPWRRWSPQVLKESELLVTM